MTLQEELHPHEKIIKVLKPSFWGYFWFYVFGLLLIIIPYKMYHDLAFFFGPVGVIFILWTELRRRGTTYYISNKRLIYELKFITRNISSTVYPRIQDLRMTQGIIDRIVGTGKIWINTAGTVSVEMMWRGVTSPIDIKRLIESHMMGKRAMAEDSV